MSRAKRPHIVKRHLKHLKGVRFVVDLGLVDGKRVEKFFRTKQEAEIYLADQKEKLKRHGHTAVALTEAERILFQSSRDRLAKVNATITEATDYFLAQHRPLKETVTIGRLLELAAIDKELAGARPRYLQQFRSSCRSFIAGRAEMPAGSVTRDEVKRWILGNGFAPKTQRTYLGDLRSLFSWAVQERYLRTNPIAGDEGYIELSAETEGEIAVFDVEACARLLKTALLGNYTTFDRAKKKFHDELGFRPLLGYLALAMFAGVRPDEIKRADLTRLELRMGTVVIRGRDAKTRQRRVISLERTARIWLRLWRRVCPAANSFVPVNFDRKLKKLREKSGVGQWPNDILRHTFASYHFAKYADRARLQSQMGHTQSEDTLDRHYRGIQTLSGKTITPALAAEFWKLTPRKVRLMKFED